MDLMPKEVEALTKSSLKYLRRTLENTLSEGLQEKLAQLTIDKLPFMHCLAMKRVAVEDEDDLDAIIKIIIKAGYDINWRSNDYLAKKRASLGFTALFAAIERSNLALVECLLRNGAETDIRDNCGYSPCHWAVLVGHLPCLEALIQHGAPVASTEKERNGEDDVHPILHTAVDEGRGEIVYYLINKGLDVDEAAIYKSVLSEKALLETPSRYNTKPLETVDIAFTPLDRAVRMRKIGIIEVLIASKAKPPGFSALHFCILEGDSEVAYLLLKYYYLSEELCEDKIMNIWALHCLHPRAFQEELRVEKTIELIRLYIDAGWDVNCVSSLEMDASRLYSLQQSVEQATVSLTKFNLLHIACLREGFEIIRYLVEEEGADVNQSTDGSAQLYPLQILMIMKQWESASYLIQHGADINAVGRCRNSLIQKVSEFNYCSYCFKSVVDGDDFNAIELLLQLGHSEGLQLLDLMAIKEEANWNGAKEFRIAIQVGNPLFVVKVLERCAHLISLEDLTWIKLREVGDSLRVWNYPSLLVLFSGLKDSEHLNVNVLADILKTMVSLGYDCNLISDDLKRRHKREQLLFLALDIDFNNWSNLLLKTLLEFDHVQIDVLDAVYRNPVEHVIHQWQSRCLARDGSSIDNKCWKSNVEQNYCATAVEMLIKHGVDVSEINIRSDVKFHYGYKRMLEMMYCAGAKIEASFFKHPICHPGFIGTKQFLQEVTELSKWKKQYDKETRLDLKHLSGIAARKLFRKVEDLKLLDILPRKLKEQILFQAPHHRGGK